VKTNRDRVDVIDGQGGRDAPGEVVGESKRGAGHGPSNQRHRRRTREWRRRGAADHRPRFQSKIEIPSGKRGVQAPAGGPRRNCLDTWRKAGVRPSRTCSKGGGSRSSSGALTSPGGWGNDSFMLCRRKNKEGEGR